MNRSDRLHSFLSARHDLIHPKRRLLFRAGEAYALQLESRPDARPALEAWLRDHGTLAVAAAADPEAETLAGRGRVYVVPSPRGERWVVRHYHRGGAVAPLLGDRYLRIGTPRPLRELRLGWALEERGLPTPAHIGAAVYPAGIWYRGDLVTRYVPGSRDLAAVLFPGRSLAGGTGPATDSNGDDGPDSPDPRSAMMVTGRLFRTLHDGGVIHPDLNLKNVLIAGTGAAPSARVLDLDGARLADRVDEAARRRMIERFWRSARKWETATGRALEPGWGDAFQAGYDVG